MAAKSRQPRRIPPPITVGTGALEGEALLRESDGEIAFALWATWRAVRVWADVSPGQRVGLFTPDALSRRLQTLDSLSIPEAVSDTLRSCSEVLSPEATSAERVAEACMSVAAWATSEGLRETALEYTQLAALASPNDAQLARATALHARQLGQYARAESWYRQAIWVARQTRDAFAHAFAFFGLGRVMMQRGNLPGAHKALLRGLRSAQRQGSREATASAYHDLLAWAIWADRPDEVDRFAALALDAYPTDHPRLPSLAYDAALGWLKVGRAAEALRVFQSMPHDYGGPLEQVSIQSSLARAAAAVGDREAYEHAWSTVLTLLQDRATAQGAPSAYLYLAHGARTMGERERARWAAHRALQLASELGEAKGKLAAESLLSSLAEQDAEVRIEASQSEKAEDPALQDVADRLAAALSAGGPMRCT